jgi:hypothetical protein
MFDTMNGFFAAEYTCTSKPTLEGYIWGKQMRQFCARVAAGGLSGSRNHRELPIMITPKLRKHRAVVLLLVHRSGIAAMTSSDISTN